jgi:hypothetical protein
MLIDLVNCNTVGMVAKCRRLRKGSTRRAAAGFVAIQIINGFEVTFPEAPGGNQTLGVLTPRSRVSQI